MDELSYWLAFSKVKGLGAVRFRKLLAFFGQLSTAWQAPSSALVQAGMSGKVLDTLLATREEVDPATLAEDLQRRHISYVTWLDETYPRYLKEIAQPPPVLYYRGTLLPEDELAVAIVGTRQVTTYGRKITVDTAGYLAGNGVTVVSGLARGVDALAHQAAMDMGGRTIAVLASGVDVIYPPEHRNLAEQISQHGAVVSDYPPGTKPDAINFPPRNRIISGLSRGTVVIEAGERSGALITAKFAVEQDRDVFAVPGSVLAPMSKGTNHLLGSGAIPMTNPAMILRELGIQPGAKPQSNTEYAQFSEAETRILRLIRNEPVHIDDLCARLDLPIEKLTAELTMMELRGMVTRSNGQEYQATQTWNIG